jgi:hypothetical protein
MAMGEKTPHGLTQPHWGLLVKYLQHIIIYHIISTYSQEYPNISQSISFFNIFSWSLGEITPKILTNGETLQLCRLRRVQQVTEGVYLIDGQEAGADAGHGWLKFWMASKMDN